MIEFKQKVQLGNRISIPTPIVQAFGIKQGDDIAVYCNEEQKMLYVKLIDAPLIFDRESGLTHGLKFKNITDVKYKPITDSKTKPLTDNKPKKLTTEV